MTEAEKLILQHFHITEGREFSDKDVTVAMMRIGIVKHESPLFFHNILHKLKVNGYLEPWRDPTKKGMYRASGKDLYILTEDGAQILGIEEHEEKQQCYVSELEFEKLKLEHQNLSNQVSDFSRTKRISNWSIVIAILSLLVAIAAIMFK